MELAKCGVGQPHFVLTQTSLCPHVHRNQEQPFLVQGCLSTGHLSNGFCLTEVLAKELREAPALEQQ